MADLETVHDTFDHTGLTGVGGAGGNPVVYDIETYAAGDITVSSTTAGADAANPPDLVVAAATGDLLMVGISARRNDTSGSSLRMDVATIVSAAVVNYISSGTGTPASTGVSGWFMLGTVVQSVGGEMPYVVQAGDISGGNVTVSLRAWVSAAGPILAAQAAAPLKFWVRNLGQ